MANSYAKKEYVESDAVKQANAALQQQAASKPAAYQSQYQSGLDDTMNKILNREKFSYDLNGDALYQQYKDQYTQQGKMAMMDTIGQAQAMTGGYGNSYAQGVGQQTYQGYLQQLNNMIPELYQLALSKYQMEGEDLYNQYGLLSDRENQDYSRYRDSVDDYNTEYDRLYNQYTDERNYDYTKYADERDFDYGQYADDRAYEYQAERDKVADEQWQAEYDEDKRRYDQEWEDAHPPGGSSSSGGSSGSSKGTSSSSDDVDVEAEYLAMKKAGASTRETDSYLRAAISSGLISSNEASELRNKRY